MELAACNLKCRVARRYVAIHSQLEVLCEGVIGFTWGGSIERSRGDDARCGNRPGRSIKGKFTGAWNIQAPSFRVANLAKASRHLEKEGTYDGVSL